MAETRVYKKRFLVIFLVGALNFIQNFQWIQYSIITNVIIRFYGVSYNLVNLSTTFTSVISMLLLFPCTWILDQYGIRTYLLIGASFTFIGSILKCFSVKPNLFWVTFTGQAIMAAASSFTQPTIPQIARTWFPINEVSRATGFGIFMLFIGITTATAVVVNVVPNVEDTELIAKGLGNLFAGQAIVSTLLFILILLIVDEKPDLSPSKSEASASIYRMNTSYFESLRSILNKNFVLLLLAYGLCGGASNSIITVLNQLITTKLVNDNALVGTVGFIESASYGFAPFVIGYILDKKHWHKPLFIINCIVAALMFFSLTYSINNNNIVNLCFTTAVIGFTLGAHTPIGYNFAAELTFPEPETFSAALLILSSNIFSLPLTFIASALLVEYNTFVTDLFFSLALLIAIISLFLIKSDLRRQKTEGEATPILHSSI